MPEINVLRAFTLNLRHHLVSFPAGLCEVTEEIASHWYTQLHSERVEAVPSGGDSASEEGDEKDALKAQAEALGIEVDGRWGVARLKSEIAAKQ